MAGRVLNLVGWVVEIIGRFWPISKTEEAILEEQRLLYGSDAGARDSSRAD